MKRFHRILLTLAIGLCIVALSAVKTAQAGTATSTIAASYTHRVGIGYTVYQRSYVEGSKSDTSCPSWPC
jgi:hypothetical protein